MKKIKIMIISLLIISSTTFALDATRLPQTYSFTPSLDTQANRAYDKAANIATKVQSAYDMALSADGIAKGTRTTLVNKNGCVYDDTFDCTNDNLTHVYQTSTWIIPGKYTWTVPADVTSIYATVTSGQGGGGGGGTGSTALSSYPGSNGKNGGISSVGSLLLSNEGNGGNGGSKGDGYNDNVYDGGNGGFGLISIKSKYITVTLGQSITITVGNGGNGGNGSYWRGTAGGIGGTGNGSGGHREKANVNAQGGAGGAHGSVVIKY